MSSKTSWPGTDFHTSRCFFLIALVHGPHIINDPRKTLFAHANTFFTASYTSQAHFFDSFIDIQLRQHRQTNQHAISSQQAAHALLRHGAVLATVHAV
jgi:hypothetical protein